MLTDDKTITTPEYWQKIYEGKNHNAKVDASNTKRPPNPFDRFTWLANVAEGPAVLDIASGHAHTCKKMKAKHPHWVVIASDQTEAAMKAANYQPYRIIDAYKIPYADKHFNSVTISQALEYLEFPDKFIQEAKRVADYLICTCPIGNMEKWSQLRIYTEESLKEWLSGYGEIVHFDAKPGLMLAKLKFK